MSLTLAALTGDAKGVSALLRAGAKPDQTEAGWTALRAAAHEGHGEIVQQLLKAGATDWLTEKSPKRNLGLTALHHAARRGHVAVVRILLQPDGV